MEGNFSKEKTICFHCKEEIKVGKEVYYSLSSHDKNDNIYHEVKFHRQCWKDWLVQKVENRVQELSHSIMGNLSNVFGKAFGGNAMEVEA